MKPEEFKNQMDRLAETFGATQYKPARVELIWREVRDFDCKWFEKVVDGFIGSERQAPLLPEFSKHISEERERQYRIKRDQEQSDVNAFYKSTYHSDDIKTIMGMIKKRMVKEVSDGDWNKFTEMLNYMPKHRAPTRCKSCDDSGLVFYRKQESLGEDVYRCFCSKGSSKPKAYPLWRGHLKSVPGGA